MHDDIIDYQFELEMDPAFNTVNCLGIHKVTPDHRARMLDWMIEVLSKFKCCNETFFIAVSLLDRHFKLKTDVIEINELHIIGMTCMFIASKFEDSGHQSISMKLLCEKIGHKKFTSEMIKKQELEILKSIKYIIAAPTSIDFIKFYLLKVFWNGK